MACTGVFKYCLRDMLGQKQHETLCFFLDVMTSVLAECHDPALVDNLTDQVNLALARLERGFPISIQVSYKIYNHIMLKNNIKDISTHLLHHIVNGIKWFGPVYSTWMYSFERFNSWLCRRSLNRFRPEATIMETYRVIILYNY